MGMRGISMYEQPHDEPHYPQREPPQVVYVPQPLAKPKKTGKRIMIGVALFVGFILVALVAWHFRPYPWSMTFQSGYDSETTLYGAPIGEMKSVQLAVTLTNVSQDTLSPNDLQWTLTDTNTNQSYPGTMEGYVPALLSPGDSADISLGFQVPIASDFFTLSLSGPAGPDPTTLSIHFSA